MMVRLDGWIPVDGSGGFRERIEWRGIVSR